MRRSIVVAVCVVVLSLGGPAASAASAVLDQEQQAFNGSVSATPITYLAQTVTAGMTGTLDRVSLGIANFANDQTLTVEIRDRDANGAPGVTILASRAIYFPGANAFFHTVDFDFAPAATVSAGTQYAIVLRSSGTGNFTFNGYAWLGSTDPLAYSKGSAFMFFFDQWHPSTVITDFVFQTFVTPTPTIITASMNVEPDCINPDSHGVVPVTLYGSSIFDVTQIDLLTLRLAGASPALRGNGKPQVAYEDTNGDGWVDLKVKFRTDAMQLPPGGLVTLSGVSVHNQNFVASDPTDVNCR